MRKLNFLQNEFRRQRFERLRQGQVNRGENHLQMLTREHHGKAVGARDASDARKDFGVPRLVDARRTKCKFVDGCSCHPTGVALHA